jgi:hypothetical protein
MRMFALVISLVASGKKEPIAANTIFPREHRSYKPATLRFYVRTATPRLAVRTLIVQVCGHAIFRDSRSRKKRSVGEL